MYKKDIILLNPVSSKCRGFCMLKNRELILLAIGHGTDFQMKTLQDVLGLRPESIRRHTRYLEKSKMVIKTNENSYFLTSIGHESYERILDIISEYEILPDIHFTSRIYKLRSILPLIKNPISLVKIVKSINKKLELDVIDLLRIDSALKPDSIEGLLIEEIFRLDDIAELSTDLQFRDLTMLGIKPRMKIEENTPVKEILINADQKRRNGKAWEALQMFIDLLHSRNGLLPGERIVCLIGWITCIKIIKGPEKAKEMINTYLSRIDRPDHRGLLYYLKADILSDMECYQKSSELYIKSLKIIRRYKMKVSEAELLNSYGVNLFRMNQFKSAEKQWNRCRSISRRNDIMRMKTIAEVNLSDIYSMNGKNRTALDLLRNAEKYFESINDQEGICDVYFNRSIVYIREGKIDKAHDSFTIAQNFPLIYQNKKEEMLSYFNNCLEENGYTPVRKSI